TLVAAGIGVEDRLRVATALPDPEPRSATASGFRYEDALFDLLGTLAEGGGQGIVNHHRRDADRESGEHRRGDELPGGHSRSARDHQLVAARQPKITNHRADQDRERK